MLILHIHGKGSVITKDDKVSSSPEYKDGYGCFPASVVSEKMKKGKTIYMSVYFK